MTARFRRGQQVDRVGVADLLAIDELIGGWDHWAGRRAAVQALRRRPDAEILPLFLRPHWCIEGDPAYRALHDGAGAFLGIDAMFEGLTSIDEDPPA